MTHKERILKAVRGEVVDKIPYAPRLDLWHNANARAGTLPDRHHGRSADEVSRAEGWTLHKIVPEFDKPARPEDVLHRGIGLFRLKEFLFDFEFSSDVSIEVKDESNEEEDMTRVRYHTPVGQVEVVHGYTREMKEAGASIAWVKEDAIKGPEDYKVLAHIFGNLKITPDYEGFKAWQAGIADDGVAVASATGLASSSPMHFIQKTFLDATSFYLHYTDYPSEMELLAEAMAQHYDQVIEILAESPAEMVIWSANVDEMVTHPPYFEKEIMPWCQKAAEALHARGKLLLMLPDGENKGLMDLIPRCNVDVAEAVAPYPMTRVTLAEYYDRWCRSGKLTLWGGIPETLLLEKSATAAELDDFLDEMFKVIPPGKRFIAGIGDTAPPASDFQRLVHIGERFEKEGRLPMEAGSYRPLSTTQLDKAAALTDGSAASSDELAEKSVPGQAGLFEILTQGVLKGDHLKIVEDVRAMVDEGLNPKELINKGMLPAMEVIGAKFRDGTVFIPEVLKSARAMNAAVEFLEPNMASGDQQSSCKILIGTVKGDMHDIGKNMVIAMLKGVGFDLIDLGVNVPVDDFMVQVQKHRPDILGLSALLTTTMPQMEEVIQTLSEAGVRDDLKIMVGGAPVNEKFATDIGADGYAVDAGEAVDVAKSLLNIN